MRKLSLLLVPVLVAACSTAPAPGATPAPAPAPAPAAAMSDGFPMVAYTVTIAEGDVPASAPADMRAAIVGFWEISFGANGHAMVNYGGRQVVDAPFAVSGNQLTFTEDSGEYACHSTARYNWHATATELHLQKVEDSCDGRAIVLTAHALVRR